MKKSFYHLILSLGLMTLLTACQSKEMLYSYPVPPEQTQPKTELRLLQNIHEHTLDNGLKIIIKEDRRAPVVMTQIWYGVGANDEPSGKGGLSHFLEHLMFKDTPKVSSDEFSRLISHYGGTNNAYTSSDVTVYHEVLPANRYALALELEANRMKNVLFKPKQIESERQVIQEERRVRTDDNPMSKAYESFSSFIYGDTPRGRPVIGSMADIEGLTIEDLQHWYATWYVPNNATIVIVGDVDKDEAINHIQKYFGNIPKGDTLPKRNPKDFIHADDVFAGKGGVNKRHLIIKEAVQVPTLILAWQAPTLSSLKLTNNHNKTQERELAALGLFDDVLSGTSGRFAKNLVKKELVTSAFSSYDSTGYGDGLFMVVATPKSEVSLDETKRLVLDEIQRTMTDPITQKELDRSLVAVKTGLIFASEGVAGQAQFLGTLKHENIPFEYIEEELAILPTITADEIKQAGKKYLTNERMYSAYILPKDE
ncbi:M16 family metallopeptidase [Moraxella oblonga]|uniref:M16 family metallopeptidase n=1 Tax=Moraxella oblonga TaxID=200413 RepID=UPI00083676DA|nr:pitrilysin family protein [Moraxella oblonga]